MVKGACSSCSDREPAVALSLRERIAETMTLLRHFHDNSPSEMHTLAINLRMIAEHADALADRGESNTQSSSC